MRSHEEQRQQKISQESSRQREAVKPQGMPERRVLRRHKSPLPLAKTRTTCWSRCSKGDNLRLAYKRVVQNGGAPGVDGVTVAELQAYLKTHWEAVKAELLAGTYRPRQSNGWKSPNPEAACGCSASRP